MPRGRWPMDKGAALRKVWRKHYKAALDAIFEECQSCNIVLSPDQSMEWMEELLESIVGFGEEEEADNRKLAFRFNAVAFRCEAHHYAVDLYYKTYGGLTRGAAPLSLEYLDRVLTLHKQGRNVPQIANQLGQKQDAIRKQIEAAQRIWDKKL